MAYTTETAVQRLLEAGLEYNGRTPLTQFVDDADIFVDGAIAYASTNSLPELSTNLKTRLATWIAAHLYQQSDKGHTRRRTGQREAYFQIQVGKGFDSTLYGQTAMMMDPTGYLKSLSEKDTVNLTMAWLGKNPPTQIDFVDRP